MRFQQRMANDFVSGPTEAPDYASQGPKREAHAFRVMWETSSLWSNSKPSARRKTAKSATSVVLIPPPAREAHFSPD